MPKFTASFGECGLKANSPDSRLHRANQSLTASDINRLVTRFCSSAIVPIMNASWLQVTTSNDRRALALVSQIQCSFILAPPVTNFSAQIFHSSSSIPHPARACISGGPFGARNRKANSCRDYIYTVGQFYRHHIELSAFRMAGDELLQHSAGPA